jgi:hypothetical protein
MKSALRVGEARTRNLDVRMIGATNRDLKKEVAQGHFREDIGAEEDLLSPGNGLMSEFGPATMVRAFGLDVEQLQMSKLEVSDQVQD